VADPNAVTDPNGNTTTITYDDQNLCPKSVSVAGLLHTSYTYGSYTFNDPFNASDPTNGAIFPNCQLQASTDTDNSVTTTYTYDNLGRQTSIAQQGSGQLSRTTSITYNDVGLSVTTVQQQSSSQ
jgi:YD repeat-containing protein